MAVDSRAYHANTVGHSRVSHDMADGTAHEAARMIPLQAVEQTFDTLPDLGGERANYPIVSHDQQYGLFHEVTTDWYGVGSQLYEATGYPQFNGDVWTIQLTARPGYYVTPEQLEAYGFADDTAFPPMG